jgi:hypothetical protein
MTPGKFLLSSAYFPPVNYFSVIAAAEEVCIEKEENYLKQSYRNRCRICSANGPLTLSVPVLEGSFHKTPFRDIRIDYSKRWQQVHIGAIESSYRSSPFFEFYFDIVREVINKGDEFLSDLNFNSLRAMLEITGIETNVKYTSSFEKTAGNSNDFRYRISPKKAVDTNIFTFSKYPQVFSERFGFVPGLSILDLIFNMGPDALDIVKKDPTENSGSWIVFDIYF